MRLELVSSMDFVERVALGIEPKSSFVSDKIRLGNTSFADNSSESVCECSAYEMRMAEDKLIDALSSRPYGMRDTWIVVVCPGASETGLLMLSLNGRSHASVAVSGSAEALVAVIDWDCGSMGNPGTLAMLKCTLGKENSRTGATNAPAASMVNSVLCLVVPSTAPKQIRRSLTAYTAHVSETCAAIRGIIKQGYEPWPCLSVP